MEWVEKTGKSVEEAKERALDQLGVTESDAELVVLAEPKTGLFGRVRGEARVRARVRPAEPRPKRQRRQRERGRPSEGAGGAEPERPAGRRTGSSSGNRQRSAAGAAEGAGGEQATQPTSNRRGHGGAGGERPAAGGPERRRGAADTGGVAAANSRDAAGESRHDHERAKEETTVADGVTLQEQAAVAKEFLEGLLDNYGLAATVAVRELDEETVELAADGDGLGILVGPKGATIAALQDVTRTVVQRRFPNKTDRILVDVAGYRERRIAALRRFTQQVADEVLSSRVERALEPMTPADRKVVHDAAAEIEGVASSSQGEEPNRFVVLSPVES